MTLKPGRRGWLFAGIIALVHVLYFILASRYTRIYMGDSYEYIYEALNIRDRFFFYSGNPSLPIMPEYMTQRQPAYPLFLMGVYLFTTNNWVVLILQNLLSIFNICYCRNLFHKLGLSAKFDWLLLLFVIAYPAQFINANTIAPDILLQSFTVLYAGSFLRLFSTRNVKYALHMSLWLVCGFMVKPVLYPFVVVHLALIVALCATWRVKLQRPLLIALLPICGVLLYNYSNYTRTGKFHFSSNQAFNAVYYFYAYINQKEGVDSGTRFLANERANINAIPDYKDRYDEANARGVELFRQNMVPYLGFHLKNSGRIFIEPGKAEIDLFTGRLTYGRLYSRQQTGFYATLGQDGVKGLGKYVASNPSFPLVMLVLLFNIVRLLGLLLFLFRRSTPVLVRLFMLIFMGYFAVAAGPIANTRYFLPVSLLAICAAALGYQQTFQKRIATT